MMSSSKKIKFPSELRLDLVSNDWVVVATGRAKRPKDFKRGEKKEIKSPESKCPFCNIETQKPPTLIYHKDTFVPFEGWNNIPDDWSVIVIPNKYPAFLPYSNLGKKIQGGLYQKINAAGFHEIVITRDHNKHFGKFSVKETKEVFDSYQFRYMDLMKKRFVNYISIFHNHGPSAGASITHPHSQIITTPLVDVDLGSALNNAERYYNKEKKCVYCQMIKLEKKLKQRIVFENEQFIATCPFASKSAFQVIVSPKNHNSYFEEIKEDEKWHLAEVFQAVMAKLYKGLGEPDYNFYLHAAPCDGSNHDYYHWHWTILPKTGTWAGFEIGTRMEISTIEPEKAAEYLRKQ